MPVELEAYCVKCRAPRKMLDTQMITTKNGKPAARGKCPICGTVMMKFTKSSDPTQSEPVATRP